MKAKNRQIYRDRKQISDGLWFEKQGKWVDWWGAVCVFKE